MAIDNEAINSIDGGNNWGSLKVAINKNNINESTLTWLDTLYFFKTFAKCYLNAANMRAALVSYKQLIQKQN